MYDNPSLKAELIAAWEECISKALAIINKEPTRNFIWEIGTEMIRLIKIYYKITGIINQYPKTLLGYPVKIVEDPPYQLLLLPLPTEEEVNAFRDRIFERNEILEDLTWKKGKP